MQIASPCHGDIRDTNHSMYAFVTITHSEWRDSIVALDDSASLIWNDVLPSDTQREATEVRFILAFQKVRRILVAQLLFQTQLE